jgi:hypothetical protein
VSTNTIQTKQCAACGLLIPEKARFCLDCGASQNRETEAIPAHPSHVSGKRDESAVATASAAEMQPSKPVGTPAEKSGEPKPNQEVGPPGSAAKQCSRCGFVGQAKKQGVLNGYMAEIIGWVLVGGVAIFWALYATYDTYRGGTFGQEQALNRAEILSFVFGVPALFLLFYKVPQCSQCGSRELVSAEVQAADPKGGEGQRRDMALFRIGFVVLALSGLLSTTESVVDLCLHRSTLVGWSGMDSLNEGLYVLGSVVFAVVFLRYLSKRSNLPLIWISLTLTGVGWIGFLVWNIFTFVYPDVSRTISPIVYWVQDVGNTGQPLGCIFWPFMHGSEYANRLYEVYVCNADYVVTLGFLGLCAARYR